ncbi:hypothetical protein [Methylibium sp.]|uniref:hypothetical protein n=1 Tax=Methylibium sp. TaxID=2067992 RepID=UPI00286D00EF|nr:hypothetical protein [Methylibium sp.]
MRHAPRGDLDVGFSTLETTVFAKARPGRRQRFIEAVSALLRLPCGARARGPSRNSLRSLRSLRSNKRATNQMTKRAARAATSPVLRSASKARCRLPRCANLPINP